jgi:hypothetical protein
VSSSSDEEARRWLSEAVATRDLERLAPNMAAAGDRINDARRHVQSARTIAKDDRTLALAACHDAIRKAITGHMAAAGYRPRAGEGAHRIVLAYARHQLHAVIPGDQIDDADAIRRDRGIAEYGDFASSHIDTDHVLWAADLAQGIVNAVANDLARRAKTSAQRKPRR